MSRLSRVVSIFMLFKYYTTRGSDEISKSISNTHNSHPTDQRPDSSATRSLLPPDMHISIVGLLLAAATASTALAFPAPAPVPQELVVRGEICGTCYGVGQKRINQGSFANLGGCYASCSQTQVDRGEQVCCVS